MEKDHQCGDLSLRMLIKILNRILREHGNLKVALITEPEENLFSLDYHPQIDVVETPDDNGKLRDIVGLAPSSIPIAEYEDDPPPPPPLKLIKNDPPT